MFAMQAGLGCGARSERAKPVVAQPVSQLPGSNAPANNPNWGTPLPGSLSAGTTPAGGFGGANAPAGGFGSGTTSGAFGSSTPPPDNAGGSGPNRLLAFTVQMPYPYRPIPSGYHAAAGLDGETYWFSPELPTATTAVVRTGQHFAVRVDLANRVAEEPVHIDLLLDGELQPAYDLPSDADFELRAFRLVNPGIHVFRVSYQGQPFQVVVTAFGSPIREPGAEPEIPPCSVWHEGDGAGIPCRDPDTGNITDFYDYKQTHRR